MIKLHVCASLDRKRPWQVRMQHGRRTLKLFSTKAAAMRSAFRRAYDVLYIHARDGRVQNRIVA